MKKFCPECATALPSPATTHGPQACPGCGAVHYTNPRPVAVALVPVAGPDGALQGMVGVLRSARTGLGAGQWALPGGYVECWESAAQAASRELQEETGLMVDPADFVLQASAPSTNGEVLLVFLRASQPLAPAAFAQATACPTECAAVGLLTATTPLAFPTHQDQLAAGLALAGG